MLVRTMPPGGPLRTCVRRPPISEAISAPGDCAHIGHLRLILGAAPAFCASFLRNPLASVGCASELVVSKDQERAGE